MAQMGEDGERHLWLAGGASPRQRGGGRGGGGGVAGGGGGGVGAGSTGHQTRRNTPPGARIRGPPPNP